MEVKQVLGNTFCIDTGMTNIPFYKINDEEIIMLDSGWAIGERKGIQEILDQNNFRVAAIICTHAHRDHVGNNSYLKNKYNCIIAMSEYEANICKATVNLKAYYNSLTLSDIEEYYGDMVFETDIVILQGQESIYVYGTKFKILSTPGHSPAHISIITPDNVAYIGDALISYEVMKGAKMPYAYLLKEDMKSKEKLYYLKCSKYIVSHKGIYDDITELIDDNLEFYKNRAVRICNLIDGLMTFEDLFKVVINNFNINVKSKHNYAILERMLRSYIEYLYETEAIEIKIDNGLLKYSKIIS